MGRPLRLDPPGGRHRVHVVASRPVFDDAARATLGALLAELPGRYGVEVLASAVEPDQLTLAVRSARGRLSDGLGWLCASLSRAIPGDGPLFRSRFRSALVEDDAIWQGLLSTLGAAAPAAPALTPLTPGRALQEVQAVTGQPREALSQHRRGVANPAVWLAVWWLSRRTTLSQREIGALIGVDQTGVAHRLRRAEAALQSDPSFQTLAGALEERAARRAKGDAPAQRADDEPG